VDGVCVIVQVADLHVGNSATIKGRKHWVSILSVRDVLSSMILSLLIHSAPDGNTLLSTVINSSGSCRYAFDPEGVAEQLFM